ncbi:hypothetical protein BJX96DRAFT_105492 [Aspergillus floccosus]
MSGLLEEVGTPCPSRLNSSRLERSRKGSDSFDSLWEDSLSRYEETVNVDFTTEIKAPILTGGKPKRRTKTTTAFAIHDEGEDKPAPPTATLRKGDTSTSNRKSSLLAQPAQRFRPKVSFAPSPSSTSKNARKQGSLERRRENEGVEIEKNKDLLMQINGKAQESRHKDVLKKDIRRNTVYIPPDDTTVASVFMGIFSPLKSDPSTYQLDDTTQVSTLESRIMKKRQAKRSLATSAQRVPLQPSSKVAQEHSIHIDVAGKNGGKENIPPGTVFAGNKDSKVQPEKHNDVRPICKPIAPPPRASISKPLAAKTTNGSLQRAMNECRNNAKSRSRHTDKERELMSKKDTNPVQKVTPPLRASTMSRSLKQSRSDMVLSRSTMSRSSAKLLDEYPLISENITDSSMYEDNWLSHQEVVITQLVNDLFRRADGRISSSDPAILRHELLSIYQDASFTHLYKRVKASLLYGAMSIPKDVLSRNMRLKQDVGMKRKFLDFWLQTYDMRALRAAVETVTGRQVPNFKIHQDDIHGAAANASNDKVLKRKLEHFLDTFLLQNQDMDLSSEDFHEKGSDAASRAYLRTVLRSLMIIILLDRGRMSADANIPRLFLPSSQFKSSATVLKGFARFLLPSCGDIIKALGHLDCHLSYEQQPLQEYSFAVDNLAVDMRDGVRLTRIVELLLYSPPADLNSQLPLSKQLKFPCLSRAVKLFNIQIALNALRSTPSRELVDRLRAEDIVDGHREKTIALLWGLISKWDLSGLVDLDEVRNEVDRLKQKAISQLGHEQVKDEEWFQAQHYGTQDDAVTLLKQWAVILAQLRGLRAENLTTSFADGKIYESIVDEYESHLVGQSHNSSSCKSTTASSLQTRLRALGCSEQFATLIASPGFKSHIPDYDFTVGALAFLCSRLLSATKRARAATVLQRRRRRILTRRDLQRRALARDVARQCAAVVRTKDQILWAKGVILRWWRVMKARRQRRRVKTSGRTGQIAAKRLVPLRGHAPRY